MPRSQCRRDHAPKLLSASSDPHGSRARRAMASSQTRSRGSSKISAWSAGATCQPRAPAHPRAGLVPSRRSRTPREPSADPCCGRFAQHLRARGDGHFAVDIDGVPALVVRRVHDEADLRLHRAAGKIAHAACAGHIFFRRATPAGSRRALRHGAVDGDAERSILAVLHHENDGAREARVSHSLRRNQQLSGKRNAVRHQLVLRQRGMKEGRRQRATPRGRRGSA